MCKQNFIEKMISGNITTPEDAKQLKRICDLIGVELPEKYKGLLTEEGGKK
jgi:hypothetical protein